MDQQSIFQKIKERITKDDATFLLISVCFFLVFTLRMILGFIPWYLTLLMIPMFLASLLRPKGGLFSILFLTVLFERFFTLEGIQLGNHLLKLYPLDIVLLGVYIGVFIRMIHKRWTLIMNTANLILLFFFLIATLYFVSSVIGFGSQSTLVAFSTWKNYVFYGMIFFILPSVLENIADVKYFVRYFIASVMCAIIFLVIGILRGGGLWTEFTPLSTSGIRLLAFPHAFYFSLAFLGLFVTETFWANSRYRAFFWVILAIWMFGILGSLMRHMWIGMFLALCFSYIVLFDHLLRTRVKKMFLIAFSFGIILFLTSFFLTLTMPNSTLGHFTQSIVETVSTRFSSIGKSTDTSISWRGSTWNSAFSALSESPFLGLGFVVRIPVESGDYHDFVEIRNIHNSWLALLVQMGIVNFILFFIFLFSLIWKTFRVYTTHPFLSALRIALLTVIVYQGIVFLAQPYLETNLMGLFFWLSLGMMNVLLALVKEEVRNEKEV